MRHCVQDSLVNLGSFYRTYSNC